MIMLISKKTIVFVQSARETCGCTRRFRTDSRRGFGRPHGRPVARPQTARGATHARGAHAGPRLLLFGAVVGVCLTESGEGPEKNEKNLHFRSLRCNVAGDAC